MKGEKRIIGLKAKSIQHYDEYIHVIMEDGTSLEVSDIIIPPKKKQKKG